MTNRSSKAFGGVEASAQPPQSVWTVGAAILDDYLIETELGRGGMGRVWLVKSQSTGRQFAVKQALIRDEKHRKAFLAELQTWIDLPEHPNIVPCRFFRTVGDEIVIFADYIEGGSLADWIAKGKLNTLEQILDVAIQFAWGMHAIHERGLIHQDVKPGNVLMTPEGVPMVTDFGLARARLRGNDGSFVSPVEQSGQQSVLVSSGGMTPAYASPEQRAGQPLSRKTDIWSWGVSLLDMFMGGVSCPHGGHIARDVLESFIDDGRQDEHALAIPEDIADVLHRCLAKDPHERWDNMQDPTHPLIHAYMRVAGRIYARAPVRSPQSEGQVAQHERRIKNAQWRDPRQWLREAYRAVGRDPAEAADYQLPDALSRRGFAVGDLAIYDEVERMLTMVISIDDMDNANLLATFFADKALLCFALDDTSGAMAAADRCIEIRQHLVSGRGRRDILGDLATAYMHKAMFSRGCGDHQSTVALYDQCIAIRERLVEQDGRAEVASDLARAYMNKGCVLVASGDPSAGVAILDRSIATFRRAVRQNEELRLDDELAHAYMNKAGALLRTGDAEGAVAAYDMCIQIRAPLVEREGRQDLANDLADALMGQAVAVNDLGDSGRALDLYDRCIAIRKALVEIDGRDDVVPDLAHTYVNKANALRGIGEMRGALALYDRAISIYQRLVTLEGRDDLAHYMANAQMCRDRAEKASEPASITLPSGLALRISANAILDLSSRDTWYRCPDGHFWFRTPNMAMKTPPYTPSDEIVFDSMSAPVPTSRAEAMEYVHVYIDDPTRGTYWRGDWMADFHQTHVLSENDKAAWLAWASENATFLDDVIALAAAQADIASRKEYAAASDEGVYGDGIVATDVPREDPVIRPVVYSLTQRLNSSHRLPSAIQQLDYEMALQLVASDVEKSGMKIVGVEQARSSTCSLVAEGPDSKVAIKIVVARAPSEPSFTEQEAHALNAFARKKGCLAAMAPVGLMAGAKRSPDGQQGFHVKYQGMLQV